MRVLTKRKGLMRSLCPTIVEPLSRPHTTKLLEAPCHSPERNITSMMLTCVRTVPFREPPSGMKM